MTPRGSWAWADEDEALRNADDQDLGRFRRAGRKQRGGEGDLLAAGNGAGPRCACLCGTPLGFREDVIYRGERPFISGHEPQEAM